MQKIIPHLWFDDKAEEAVTLYTSIFTNARIVETSRYGEAGAEVSGRKAGSMMNMTFELAGQRFMALNGGPHFQFTPALSLFVDCETEEEIDMLWEKLSAGGMALMELGEYPFSKKFGWLMDAYGLTWQLSLSGNPQSIAPFFMFVGEQHGRAEEAISFYTSLFDHSKVGRIERYGANETDPEGTVKHASFTLYGQPFMAIDSGFPHAFTFNEAFSLFVNCDSQEEVDQLWNQFSDGGEPGQCGWLKDKFGVSWQIVPSVLGELMQKDPRKSEKVMQALLQMKKIEIAGLTEAYERG
ncbi:MAG TPA: VOC family protein [Bacillales bacterium]|nr:VOC family protein [Bacillales bacterium]